MQMAKASLKIKKKHLFRLLVSPNFIGAKPGPECKKTVMADQNTQEYAQFHARHPIHIEQLLWFQSLCDKPSEELFDIAQSYMATDAPAWHAVIAFFIFENLYFQRKYEFPYKVKHEAYKKGWPEGS